MHDYLLSAQGLDCCAILIWEVQCKACSRQPAEQAGSLLHALHLYLPITERTRLRPHTPSLL